MTDDQIQLAFLDWWKDSYPMVPPNPRTIDTHVAFAAHIQALSSVLGVEVQLRAATESDLAILRGESDELDD